MKRTQYSNKGDWKTISIDMKNDNILLLLSFSNQM